MERFEDFDYENYNEETDEKFEITNASQANWAINKIAEEKKRTEYFVAVAEEEIKKLQGQINEAKNKYNNATNFYTGLLAKYINTDDAPKKVTKTQESITLPAGKIIKKLPKLEYTMVDGKDVSKEKGRTEFVKEVKEVSKNFIKVKEEVDWANFKKQITSDEEGNVYFKDSGELIESLKSRYTTPSVEVKVGE